MSDISKNNEAFESFILNSNNRLQGDIGELVFKHYCQKNEFAYIRLEKIFKTFRRDNILEFKYQNQLINVQIPDEIAEEVWKTSIPSNDKDDVPTYVVDFLTVNLGFYFDKKDGKYIRNKKKFYKDSFAWAEIKTGKSELSRNQLAIREKSLIPFKFFRVNMDYPQTIEIVYENRSEFSKCNILSEK